MKPKAMIGDIDVTDMVASMYDNLINSMDWGSEFLSHEDIVSIVAVGKLLGFEVPDANIGGHVPRDPADPPPQYPPRASRSEIAEWAEKLKEHKARQILRWRAQIDAAVAAKLSKKEDA